MSRLIVYAWFPHLAAERLRRSAPIPSLQPVILIAKYHGADIVEAICRRAAYRGLRAGMRLADARALCHELASFDNDPAADKADLRRLALWARRYCPLTAADDPDGTRNNSGNNRASIMFAGNGIWLDVAGADHLHGGIRSLLADMAWRLRKAGLTVRLAAAPTCGAAWALARYGNRHICILAVSGKAAPANINTRVNIRANTQIGEHKLSSKSMGTMLANLPLAALRIDSGICAAMSTAGLRVIGDIIGMARAPLAARFGTQLIERLDAALGYINESFTPIAPPRPLLTMQNFAEPVAAPDDIKSIIRRLAEDIGEMLQAEGMATRRLRLGWKLVDGDIGFKDVHLSRPNRDVAAFHRLLAETSNDINPEFGLETAWIEAHHCSPQAPVAISFNEGTTPSESHADLVDRLVARLGYGAVLQMKSHACWQPEKAQYMTLPDDETAGSNWQDTMATIGSVMDAAPQTISPRPIRLLAHPQRVAVTALLPDHPPAQFVWGKRMHKISRASGPERIAPEWWLAASGTRTRDYFRLQDDQGARFWVYREGLPERSEETGWFLHGFFA